MKTLILINGIVVDEKNTEQLKAGSVNHEYYAVKEALMYYRATQDSAVVSVNVIEVAVSKIYNPLTGELVHTENLK